MTSKRNRVLLVRFDGHPYIIKHYSDREGAKREAQTLELLYTNNTAVPKVLHRTESALVLEYLQGRIYADLTEEAGERYAAALCEWFKCFYHAVPGKLRGDVNLRNFIYREGTCYGLDFEDALVKGGPETDLGRLLAYLMTYDPPMTPLKRSNASIYFGEFVRSGFDPEKMNEAYQKEIASISERRGRAFEKETWNFWY